MHIGLANGPRERIVYSSLLQCGVANGPRVPLATAKKLKEDVKSSRMFSISEKKIEEKIEQKTNFPWKICESMGTYIVPCLRTLGISSSHDFDNI